jgi:hypothetical protein
MPTTKSVWLEKTFSNASPLRAIGALSKSVNMPKKGNCEYSVAGWEGRKSKKRARRGSLEREFPFFFQKGK